MKKTRGKEDKLPRITILDVEELEPQVRLTLEIEGADRLLEKALDELTREEIDSLILSEFLRRVLMEMAEKEPERTKRKTRGKRS